jgi:hypothetical protein
MPPAMLYVPATPASFGYPVPFGMKDRSPCTATAVIDRATAAREEALAIRRTAFSWFRSWGARSPVSSVEVAENVSDGEEAARFTRFRQIRQRGIPCV